MAKKLKVTLKKSGIGRTPNQKACLSGLGLKKLNKTRELSDTPEVRGMIRKVIHMVEVEEV